MSGYLSERELELLTLAAFSEWRRERGNPDSGVLLSCRQIVEQVASQLTFKVCEIDITVAAGQLAGAINDYKL